MRFNSLNWSGKEDSNLRPLPPENVAPERTRRFSVVRGRAAVPFSGACSWLIPGFRFKLDLRPLSMGLGR